MSLPMAEVVWVDSSLYGAEWHDVDDLPPATTLHRAVGYVVGDGPEVLTLAAAVSEDGTRATGIVAIPQACVRRRRAIEPMGADG